MENLNKMNLTELENRDMIEQIINNSKKVIVKVEMIMNDNTVSKLEFLIPSLLIFCLNKNCVPPDFTDMKLLHEKLFKELELGDGKRIIHSYIFFYLSFNKKVLDFLTEHDDEPTIFDLTIYEEDVSKTTINGRVIDPTSLDEESY